MGNFQTDRVIQILLPLFQGLSGQPVYQVDAYVLDAVFFAKPDCAQSLFALIFTRSTARSGVFSQKYNNVT